MSIKILYLILSFRILLCGDGFMWECWSRIRKVLSTSKSLRLTSHFSESNLRHYSLGWPREERVTRRQDQGSELTIIASHVKPWQISLESGVPWVSVKCRHELVWENSGWDTCHSYQHSQPASLFWSSHPQVRSASDHQEIMFILENYYSVCDSYLMSEEKVPSARH